MKNTRTLSSPLILFWLGVLTGALLVGLLFLYRLYGDDISANLLQKYPVSPTYTKSVQLDTTKTLTAPAPTTTTQPVQTGDEVKIGDTPWW